MLLFIYLFAFMIAFIKNVESNVVGLLSNDQYNPDPNAFVVNDTIYVITGHDRYSNQYFLNMSEYMLYTYSGDNWINHGVIINPENDLNMTFFKNKKYYAAGATYFNNTFFVIFPFYETKVGIHGGRMCIIKSTTPTIRHSWELHICLRTPFFDPSFMMDEISGKVFVYGSTNKKTMYKEMWVGLMNEQMTEIINITYLGDKSVEALFAFQRYSYKESSWKQYLLARKKMGNRDGTVVYEMSTPNQLIRSVRPYMIHPTTLTAPAHTSIVQYRGRWYLFYHCALKKLNGTKYKRSSCVDEILFDENDKLIPITELLCTCEYKK